MDIRIKCVVVHTAGCERLAPFWLEALGWRITHQSLDEWAIEPPEGSAEVDVGPDILFVKVPDTKTVKNRPHFDLRPLDQAAQVNRWSGSEPVGSRSVSPMTSHGSSWQTPRGTTSACSPLFHSFRTESRSGCEVRR